MNKKIITNLLKFALAFGLLFALIQSGKLDFSLLAEVVKKPISLAIAFILMQVIIVLIAFRLRLLIQHRAENKISLIKMFFANWIGAFFNSVLPGSVTGDLVKILYIKDLDQKFTRRYLLLAVFLDRVIGLMGLIVVGGIVCIVNYSYLIELSPDLSHLIHINLLLLLGVLASICLIFIYPQLVHKALAPFKIGNLATKVINKVESIWKDLCQIRKQLLGLLGISMVVQTLSIIIFWYVTHPFAEGDFQLLNAFSILPVGFISIAIPISPAGLGVGHVVFDKLLNFINVTNGASLFNIYFFLVMFSNLTGVLPYLFYSNKKKIDLKNLESN